MAKLHRAAFARLVGVLVNILPATAAVASTTTHACASGLGSYDFIIVGGGTAGLVVATRLSQRLPTSCVLVIEAGDDGRTEPGIVIPGNIGSTIGTKYDWNLTTVVQPNANGRILDIPRGKVLGGSSAMNFMTWDRGSIKDYDAWEELGNPGWNWKSIQTAMLKAENFVPSPEFAIGGVGKGGPIQTLISSILPTQQLAFIPTLNGLGVKENLAALDGHPIGVMRQLTNTRLIDYTRSYSTSYIDIAGKNLVLMLNTRVAKVNFVGTKASGVTLEDGTVISATKEVILSAGSIHSPSLLELSGIGNGAVLAAAGVKEVISELPGVGENLQDHARIQSSYKLLPSFVSFDRIHINATYAADQLALYDSNLPSAYGNAGSDYAYLNWSQVSNSTNPNLLSLARQFANLSNPIDAKKLDFLSDPKLTPLMSQLEIMFTDGYAGVKGYPAADAPFFGSEFFSLLAISVHPFSRGSVHVKSADFNTPPVIDTKYLDNPYDLHAMIAAAKYMRTIASAAPMSSVWDTEYEPGLEVETDEEWEAYTRDNILTIFHPVGTCAMLPRKDGGVVDPKLRVYGVSRLRVVDASIIPIIPGAHIQATVYGIAEMAADIIVAEWK
ncbi:hypothetical protein V493_00140 [Pseudogymnoascus sp. VKM F-4281 (FW-2241)]|nr:hypothetical protein V493_00140 [Pseudogymnoascus sp. VKM F-4281 (FW-2241)]